MREGPKPFMTLVILIVLLLFVGVVFGYLKMTLGQDLQGNLVVEDGSVAVHFCPVENCEGILIDMIGKSSDIQCVFYDLELSSVIELLEEKNADVLVFDENYQEVFVPVPSKGLMHHKFCVLDNDLVVTGSMNPTENGAYRNDNNLVVLNSPTIARRYLAEFRELSSRKDGSYTKRRTVPRFVQLPETLVDLRFCPQERCERAVLAELEKAENSITFMTFSFTSDPIGDALLAAVDRGISVAGVLEKRQKSVYSEYEKLTSWGLNVTWDGNPKTMHHKNNQSIVYPKLGVLHHKVFIIDEEVVITGSYNPTKNGNTRNDENLLIIHDREIAAEFLGEFDRIWTRASLAAQ